MDAFDGAESLMVADEPKVNGCEFDPGGASVKNADPSLLPPADVVVAEEDPNIPFCSDVPPDILIPKVEPNGLTD